MLPCMAALAERLKRVREKRGLSQTELARRAGVRQGTLSRLESGESSEPLMSTAAALAKVLEVPIEFFFDGEDSAAVPA